MAKAKFPLINGIIDKSISKKWDIARSEWILDDVYESDFAETCLCGHYPIKEICVLKNKHNGEIIEVGNCCVNKVWDFSGDKIFSCVKRIKKDITKSVNLESLDHALNKGIINKKDYEFYSDIWRKRNLSEKQEKWKIDINRRVLAGLVKK